MTTIERVGAWFAVLVMTFAVGGNVGAAMQHDHQPPPHVTVCKTRVQTGCLWIDGHAEWH